jgi:hypothetical protein
VPNAVDPQSLLFEQPVEHALRKAPWRPALQRKSTRCHWLFFVRSASREVDIGLTGLFLFHPVCAMHYPMPRTIRVSGVRIPAFCN